MDVETTINKDMFRLLTKNRLSEVELARKTERYEKELKVGGTIVGTVCAGD